MFIILPDIKAIIISNPMKNIVILVFLTVILSLRVGHERLADSVAEVRECMDAANKVIGVNNGVLSYGGSNFTVTCHRI